MGHIKRLYSRTTSDMINDAHCHFFSARLFEVLGQNTTPPLTDNPAISIPERLGWEPPGPAATLADRWVEELDQHGITRAAIMASVPDDEASVTTAVRRHPGRFVGMTMVDPTTPGTLTRVKRALETDGLRSVCLFPAMHGYQLSHEAVEPLFAMAEETNAVVFVHCGMLTIGVRRKLGIPTPVDLRAGDPLAVAALASRHPKLPVVIPHFGAGLLRETLMAADLCPNIYLDTSSSNSWIKYLPSLKLLDVFRQAIETLGPERLLFGTDSSFFPRGWQKTILETQLWILDELKIDSSGRKAILAGNFDSIFNQTTPT